MIFGDDFYVVLDHDSEGHDKFKLIFWRKTLYSIRLYSKHEYFNSEYNLEVFNYETTFFSKYGYFARGND